MGRRVPQSMTRHKKDPCPWIGEGVAGGAVVFGVGTTGIFAAVALRSLSLRMTSSRAKLRVPK